MNEIKYIGYYNLPNLRHQRAGALSAINKMDYICEAINKAGYNVHLVSPSCIVDKGVELQNTILLSKTKKVTFCPSLGCSSKFREYLSIVLGLAWLFIWLLINVKRNEKILVYHSPWLALPILLAKKIKGFKLILEVEEVYSDVSSLHPYFDKLEQEIFENSDFFLFSTELLAKKIDNKRKHIIIYGNYSVPDTLAHPLEDGKIHLVYAGIIDSHKAGAFNAIESALYLPGNYMMHIIGFGEVDKLTNRIEQINKISSCKVFYDGVKMDKEYVKFCQSCHIGLSTQKMEGTYLDTSFPSKILSYLGMGLKVVSCYVSCVAQSKIRDEVTYYKEDNPKSIAEAIMKVKIDSVNTAKKVISQLDDEFVQEIKGLFKC